MVQQSWVAGVDGCRAGWVVVLRDLRTLVCSARIVASFADLLTLPERPAVIGVDMPIGLLDVAVTGGRACEVLARRLLPGRASSVFSSPTRSALAAFQAGGEYAAVCAANRAGVAGAPGISQQTYALLKKIGEVDALASGDGVIREVHPELSFAGANGGVPMRRSKKRSAGRAERVALLERLGFVSPLSLLGAVFPRNVERDDLLDACIACWIAERIARGTAQVIPSEPVLDAMGIKMELWR